MTHSATRTKLLALLIGAQACHLLAPDPRDPQPPDEEGAVTASAPLQMHLRRLTAWEYDNALEDLLDDETRRGSLLLPADPRTPFDNDATDQMASQALIEAAELLARDAAARLLSDDARREHVVGCADASCFSDFVERFGRRALRAPLDEEERMAFTALAERHAFDDAVEIAITAFLQHPRFLYRVEVDELDGYEMAARLSFTLWGTIPDDQLLDAAAAGDLDVRVQARRMLGHERARRQIGRILAMWMGTESLVTDPSLAEAMRAETNATIARVVFEERRPWRDLFTLDETFVTPELAAHYGFGDLTEARWIADPRGDRAGILGHGTFLSIGGKHGDTSPTLRGLAVRERLLCERVGTPPPGVEVDDPIPALDDSPCKEDRYRTAHATGGCASCHQRIDAIGFGLERYDAHGRYREVEAEEPTCAISGDGEVVELGAFNGPGELGALLAASEQLGPCLTEQLVRYALGRSRLEDADVALIDALSHEERLDDLIVELVSHPAFTARLEEK